MTQAVTRLLLSDRPLSQAQILASPGSPPYYGSYYTGLPFIWGGLTKGLCNGRVVEHDRHLVVHKCSQFTSFTVKRGS